MGQSLNINTYADIRQQLDEAINMGGARITFSSNGQAVHWRLRAYKFRALHAKNEKERSLVPGYTPNTPYDNIVMTIEGSKDNVVLIKFREIQGTMTPLSEKERSVPIRNIREDDPLMLEAQRMMKEHNNHD